MKKQLIRKNTLQIALLFRNEQFLRDIRTFYFILQHLFMSVYSKSCVCLLKKEVTIFVTTVISEKIGMDKCQKSKSKGPAVLHPKTTGLPESTRHGMEHNKCVTNKACFRSLSLMQCYPLLVECTYCRDIWRTH